MPANALQNPRPDVNRQRHVKAISYAAVGFGSAIGARFLMGLGIEQTFAFSVSVYVALVMMNYRTLLMRAPANAASAVDARPDRRP